MVISCDAGHGVAVGDNPRNSINGCKADCILHDRDKAQEERRLAKANQGLSPFGQVAADWWHGGPVVAEKAEQRTEKEKDVMSVGEDTEDDDDDEMHGVRLEKEDELVAFAGAEKICLPIRER